MGQSISLEGSPNIYVFLDVKVLLKMRRRKTIIFYNDISKDISNEEVTFDNVWHSLAAQKKSKQHSLSADVENVFFANLTKH